MQNVLRQTAPKMNKQRKNRQWWQRAVRMMAMVVVFCTTYALILPAITMQAEPICGVEAHTHNELCYTEQGGMKYSCDLPEEALVVHTHDALCCDPDGALKCSLTEQTLHVHTDSCYESGDVLACEEEHEHEEGCYQKEQTLICTLEVLELHQHDAACYDAEEKLLCTLPQVVLHQHEETCAGYEKNQVLTCELPEHTHEDACYPVEESDPVDSVYSCGLGVHKHAETCLDGEANLACNIPEHAHEAACIVKDLDLNADVETEEQWKQAADQLTFTGNWNEDLLTVALSQLGYTESGKNVVLVGDALKGYTRYGAKYGTPYEDWNTLFVRFCLEYANTESEFLPHTALLEEWMDALVQEELYVPYEGGELIPGDILFFAKNEDNVVDHIAVLEEQGVDLLGNTEIHTIEGLPGEGVVRKVYGKDDLKPVGYVDISVAFAAYQESLVPVTPEDTLIHNVWMYTDETYTNLCADTAAIQVIGELPMGAVVYAYPVTVDVDTEVLCAYDINIFLEDGTEYQPEQPLTVQIMADFNRNNLAVYHMTEDGIEDVAFSAEADRVEFQATSFSIYAVVDTTALITLGEPGNEEAMQALRDSGYFDYWEQFITDQSQTNATGYGRRAIPALMNAASTFSQTAGTSATQIIDGGGTNEESKDEGVYISKTIHGTDQENVFDIVLRVTTTTSIEEFKTEPDMAVVVVMDISNTMTEVFPSNTSVTRYQAAMDAAEKFVDSFAATGSKISEIGFVAFNTNAHQIFDMRSCSSPAEAVGVKNAMRKGTEEIIFASGYSGSHSRFTNIESGLKMGYDLLDKADNEHKYIIFISDGFPTTYAKRSITDLYTGWDPYCSKGTVGNDGVFYDNVTKEYSVYGTSYSNKAAVRAREMATTIKNSGATIFSVGVDVGGQTIERYHYHTSNSESTYSKWANKRWDSTLRVYWRLDSNGNKVLNPNGVVDRMNTTYEIGGMTDTAAYANWLRNGIGSGYYYASDKPDDLIAAYEDIFAKIQDMNQTTSQEKWVTYDPMPLDPSKIDSAVEFIGFYNQQGDFMVYPSASLAGSHTEGGENTASFGSDDRRIRWDLKNSGYTSLGTEELTQYNYQLVYRVRLKNEMSSFIENHEQPTNDTTTLTYQVLTEINGEETLGPQKTIEFPIPSVKGYLAELSFQKVDAYGGPLPGAEFTLTHDTASCGYCRGDGAAHVAVGPFVQTSGLDGVVSFSNIPSGHVYTLTETQAPADYEPTKNSYQVTVSYDALTVTVTDADGNPLEWKNTIMNGKLYVLPNTGAAGTSPYTFGGIFLLAAAALMYLYKSERKQRKGGTYSR